MRKEQDEFHVGCCPHCPLLLSGTPKLSKASKIHRQIPGTTDWAKHTGKATKGKLKVQKTLNQLTKALEDARLHIEKLYFHLGIFLEFSNKLIIQ